MHSLDRREDLSLQIFGDAFESNPESVDEAISNIENLPIIMDYSIVNPAFVEYCKQEKFKHHWVYMSSLFGKLLGGENFEYIPLPEPSYFEQVRGMYYYKVAIGIRKEDEGARQEVLRIAIFSHSPHATRDRINYLYGLIEAQGFNATSEKLFDQIFANSRELVDDYGTFSYILLGEAYFRYARYLQKKFQTQTMPDSIKKTLKQLATSIEVCLKQAKCYETKSEAAIHNASFGLGLAAINGLNCPSLDDLEKIIMAADFMKKSDTPSRTMPRV